MKFNLLITDGNNELLRLEMVSIITVLMTILAFNKAKHDSLYFHIAKIEK